MGDNGEKKSSSFLTQGIFLAAAGLISRVIGLIYRIPLASIIGKTGNDYYGTAFEIYNIVLIISSYSIPLAISKMVAARMSAGRVRDTKRVYNIGMLFAFVVGAIAFLLVFFGANAFAGNILNTPNAALALKVLAPALLIVALLGVIRGFFQGLGTMVPTAISQVVEQIINAVVSVVAAYYLFDLGLQYSESEAAKYGAAGGTLGTVSGAAIALLFLAFVKFAYNRVFRKKLIKDGHRANEKTGSILKILVMTIIPVLLSTTLYNISSIINQGIYKNLTATMGHSSQEISMHWGVFTGQYRVLLNVPVSISISLAASIVPALVMSYQQRNKRDVRNKINTGLRFISLVAFPATVGYMVLSGPLMQMLFHDSDSSSALILTIGAISIGFYSISTLTNAILQGIDKMSIPVIHAAISLFVEAAMLVVFIKVFDMHIYGVVCANIVEALMMFILNGRSIKKYTRIRLNTRRIYVIPILSSLLMGVGVFLAYQGFMLFAPNSIAVLMSIIIGMVLYFILMVVFGGIMPSDLKRIPGGRFLLRFVNKKSDESN